ncbi:MAG: STN domain-containing protein [Armatimonadota bacterium]
MTGTRLPKNFKRSRSVFTTTALMLAVVAVLAATAVWAQSGSSSDDRVTLNVKDGNIRDVLELLFKGRNASFVVDPQVYQVAPAINASVVDQPFEVALRSILNASGLKYVKSQNVYTITVKTPTTETTTTPTAPPVETTTETTTRASVTVAKIPLMRADPAEVAQVFGGTVISGGLIGSGFGGWGGMGYGGLGGYGGYGSFGGFGGYGSWGGLGYGSGFGGISTLGGWGGIGSIGGIGSWGGYGYGGGLGTGTWGGFGSTYGGLGTYGGIGTGVYR